MNRETQSRNGKPYRTRLTVAGLRRWLIYKPLTVLMTLLLLPAISWVESGGAGAPFQAQAQAGSLCSPAGNTIIRSYCVNGIAYATDLIQLEQDAVSAYLGMHGIPAADAHVIYDYGRTDLRNAVRALMMATIVGIAAKPAASRTTHEQSLYTWMQTLVHNNEISLYTNAVNEYNRWQSDACHFTMDSTIAQANGLSYDGTPFCFATFDQVFASPSVPAASYFTSYGMRKSYGAPADQYANFTSLLSGTAINLSEVAAIATTAISVVAAAGAGASFFAAAATYAASFSLAEATLDESFSLLEFFGPAAVAGPVAIVLIAVAIGVSAGMAAFSNQQAIDDLNNISKILSQVTNTLPDLNAFANDSTGLGMHKLQSTLVAQTVPEIAATAVLPQHQATDLNFVIQSSTSNTLSYKDWDGGKWSAQTWGGWFVQTCSGGTGNCIQPDSITGSLRYVDWSGVNWTATRVGSVFSLSKAKPASTDTACPADSVTGVTPGSNFSNCSSYVSTSIPLTDANGNLVKVSLAVAGVPIFTGPSYFAFGPGIASTQTITASGDPTPTICLKTGTLTSDFSLNGGVCGAGTFQITFNGNVNAATQTYPLTFTASNSGGTSTQNFTINVSPQLGIVSPNTLSATASFPVNFLVVATGSPAPTLSLDPSFTQFSQLGLSFKDNGNGTATISGVASSPGVYQCIHVNPSGDPLPCGIIATSSQGTVEQKFFLNIASTPTASVAPPIGATFIAGIPNSVTLSAIGAITPVSWTVDSLPSWLSFTPSSIDGIAVLHGTPPLGAGGTYNLFPVPTALGSIGIGLPYPLTVVVTPVFTSPNTATFTVGTNGTFGIFVNTGAISLANTLPKGLSFFTGSSLNCLFCPASISGTPAPGTGGQYTLTLSDNAGANGSTAQTLRLNVNEAPLITSPNTATMLVGMPGSFAVTTTGFPSVSNHPLPPNPLPPTDPAQGNGTYFSVIGLPASLQAGNLNAQGFATGTLTIHGTPSAADSGPHQVTITAQNAVGAAAQQTLTLNIVQITGPAPTSGSTCNGNYNGTFKGSLKVSAGQNCAFLGGGITGNVTVNGGHLALDHTTVTGNMSIQGSTAFSIGPGSAITGNLAIQNVASGSSSQICEAQVSGNVELSNNAVPLTIGSNQPSCMGNSFGGNVDISGNTAATQVYDNIVQKNLSCSSNTSITGGGNVSQKKNGQCSAF